MLLASLLMLAQAETRATPPAYFTLVAVGLLVIGALGWLIAAVLGFARARAFGASTRWFSLAAVCLLIYHLHLFVFVLVFNQSDADTALGLGAFFNLFVVLGSICAIIGFVRLTDPR
jgi:uncharacterized membrane protein YhdT